MLRFSLNVLFLSNYISISKYFCQTTSHYQNITDECHSRSYVDTFDVIFTDSGYQLETKNPKTVTFLWYKTIKRIFQDARESRQYLGCYMTQGARSTSCENIVISQLRNRQTCNIPHNMSESLRIHIFLLFQKISMKYPQTPLLAKSINTKVYSSEITNRVDYIY